MDRIVFHIDVNSAYLSWEAVARLKAGETVDLREIPAAVGGDIETRHGVILAKSIPAKKYGVTTGEPVVDALRKCPDLTLSSRIIRCTGSSHAHLLPFCSSIRM